MWLLEVSFVVGTITMHYPPAARILRTCSNTPTSSRVTNGRLLLLREFVFEMDSGNTVRNKRPIISVHGVYYQVDRGMRRVRAKGGDVAIMVDAAN
jgi:hypothetical protein